MKQMKIIHGEGYSAQERSEFVPLIHQNILDAISSLLRAMPVLGIAFETPNIQVRMIIR